MSTCKLFSSSPIRSLIVLAAIVLAAASAFATYPGKNGRIAFTADFSGTWQLYSIKPDGTDLFQITNLPPTGNLAWFQDYSPDGTRLVFCHDMTGATELYIINADGTGLMQLTHDGTENIFPHWSPDGSRILFSTLFAGGKFGAHHLATIRPDGTDRRQLTSVLYDDFQAEFTNDAKHIVFASTRHNFISALWTMNASGSNLVQVTQPALEAGGSDLSPDGQHMIFYDHQNTDLPTDLWIGNVDGTNLKQLTSVDTLNAGNPVFSPDGRKIVFNGGPLSGNPGDISVMNADGSGVHVILSCPNGCPLPDWGAKPSL